MAYEKYNFDGDFQDKILACMVAYPEKFLIYGNVLSSTYFTGVSRIAACRAILAFWRNYKSFPDWNTLAQVIYEAIARTVDEKEEDNIAKYLKVLRDTDTRNSDYVASRIVDFAKERAIYLAFENGYNNYFTVGKVPEGGWRKLFDDAMKVGVNLTADSYSICDDPDEIKRILDKLTDVNYGIMTGYPELDKIWRFGWGPGWLISILAPPKRYKTAFCLNLAMNMIGHQYGKNVFYYPCEITQELAALRCLQNVSELEAEVLWDNRPKFEEAVNRKMREHVRGKGQIIVKGFPARTASIAGDIRTDIGIRLNHYGLKKPDAIIVDFAETVKPSTDSKSRSEHRAAGEIYVEARALGAEFGCPVIMPDRCNKDTVGLRVPNMKSFQGAFEKAGHVDVAIGLCADDLEFDQGRIRYFVFLNRHGHPNQHMQGRVMANVMRMTVDSRIPYDPEQDGDEEYAGGRRGGDHRRKARKRPPVDEIQN